MVDPVSVLVTNSVPDPVPVADLVSVQAPVVELLLDPVAYFVVVLCRPRS